MNEFILMTLVIVGVSAWVITVLYKWGVLNYLYKKIEWPLFKKMLECDFCLSWWTCVLVSVVAFFFTLHVSTLFVPFVAAKFVQLIIRQDG